MKFPREPHRKNISKLVIVNLFSLLILAVAFFIILYLFSFVQNKVNTRIVNSAQKAAKSYEIGKSFARLELDIHNIILLSSHDAEKILAGRDRILAKFDKILIDVQTTENYFRGASGLVSLDNYRRALALELDDNVLVSRKLLELEEKTDEKLRLFSELEEVVGEMIIETTIAGKDPAVYRQVSSIIPYCRELILQTRYQVHRAASLHDVKRLMSNDLLADKQSISSIIELLVRTLYSLTSASPPISDRVDIILSKVLEYEQQVDDLAVVVQSQIVHHKETEVIVGVVVNFMSRVDKQTTSNLQAVVSAGNKSLDQARYVLYIVATLVMIVAIFGALMVYRIASQMAAAMQFALKSQDDLAGKIVDLDLQITRRKKAENDLRILNDELESRVVERTDQLQAANKELDSFAYSVSHDLRAPLRSIGGFSQVLEEDYASVLTGDGLNCLDRIKKGCLRMGGLIDNILQLSRLTRNEIDKSTVDLSVIVADIVSDFDASGTMRKVEWIIQPDLQANVDPIMIRVVMANLLGNAWKYTKNIDHARIEFGCRLDDEKPVYYVKDNGAGFDMKYSDKLFTAFQRLHSVRDFEGDGIGLATVQRIINRHGGRIWAEGKEGEGACFSFIV